VTDSRRALKEYRTARKRHVGQSIDGAMIEGDASGSYPRTLRNMSPIERVRKAVNEGARTQKQIRKAANLSDDEVGDALANLLLWTREIRTVLVDNERQYFVNEVALENAEREESVTPQRKRDVPSSFSALQGLMPGRNPEGETEKIGGWVAA
jgi:hypothetical protein